MLQTEAHGDPRLNIDGCDIALSRGRCEIPALAPGPVSHPGQAGFSRGEKMDANRLTQKAQEALSAAQAKAIHLSHQQVDVEHLLSALIEQERGLATAIVQKAGMDV